MSCFGTKNVSPGKNMGMYCYCHLFSSYEFRFVFRKWTFVHQGLIDVDVVFCCWCCVLVNRNFNLFWKSWLLFIGRKKESLFALWAHWNGQFCRKLGNWTSSKLISDSTNALRMESYARWRNFKLFWESWLLLTKATIWPLFGQFDVNLGIESQHFLQMNSNFAH